MSEEIKQQKSETKPQKSEKKEKTKSEKLEKSLKKDPSSLKDNQIEFTIEDSMKQPNISKDNLLPFTEETDFVLLMQKLKQILINKETDWTNHLSAINYLRRLLKFEKIMFNQVLYGLKLYSKIIEFINSIRSVLAKNTLNLVNEMFEEEIPEYDDKKNKNPIIIFIKAIIPTLIMKAGCNQSFIKNEAKICLDSLVNNMKYGETLISLIQAMSSKKNQDIELAFQYANKLIDNLSKEYLNDYPLFNELIKSIAGIYELKKDIYVKKIIVIINKLIEKISKDEFNNKVVTCPKKERELIKKALDPILNNKPRTSITSYGFQNFLKESKDRIKEKKVRNRSSVSHPVVVNTTTNTVLVKKKRESSLKKIK